MSGGSAGPVAAPVTVSLPGGCALGSYFYALTGSCLPVGTVPVAPDCQVGYVPIVSPTGISCVPNV